MKYGVEPNPGIVSRNSFSMRATASAGLPLEDQSFRPEPDQSLFQDEVPSESGPFGLRLSRRGRFDVLARGLEPPLPHRNESRHQVALEGHQGFDAEAPPYGGGGKGSKMTCWPWERHRTAFVIVATVKKEKGFPVRGDG